MPTTTDGFTIRLARLRADLAEQGMRVQALVEGAFDAAFARDPGGARRAIDMDTVVDKVDVQVERASVQLLTDATGAGAQLPEDQLRMVLTIVKVNNELERIADAGVSIAEEAAALLASNSSLPETFRVMTNSVLGILRDACASFARSDPALAKVVLASEDAVEEFKKAILRGAQEQVASGKISVDLAFSQQEIATYCEIMANHCTNIAEQVIYSATGAIVRHMAGHWEQFELPA